jgi:hypothetical protein
MRFSRGEVIGIATACVTILAVGAGLEFAGNDPHFAPHPASIVIASKPRPSPAARPLSAPAPALALSPIAPPKPSAPLSGLVIRHVLPISGPIAYGDWHWDETGAPLGPLNITVDLDARVLSVFRGGYEIATTAVLVGTQEKPTPLGVFPITQKDANHVSNLYDAPMPYMLRLTNDGVTIHATKVENGYASHGCIGVPLPFAKKLFGIIHLGDKVYVTRGKYVEVGDPLTKS